MNVVVVLRVDLVQASHRHRKNPLVLYWRKEGLFDLDLALFKNYNYCRQNYPTKWAVVVAQLAERLLLTPDVHGSNPDIGKF